MSIKGVYYRVEIMGTKITWIEPYKFNQRLPFDVDYKVMGTFLEFHQAHLKFVLYKLFSDLGMKYPLQGCDQPWNMKVAGQYDSQKVRALQTTVTKVFKQGGGAAARGYEEDAEVDPNFKDSPEYQQMQKRVETSRKQKALFSKCVVYLGRETPVYILQHLILSFGGSFVL